MTATFTLFMGKMMLVVEIKQPLLMGGKQIFPGLRSLEMPVGKPSLRVKIRLYKRLPGLPLLNFHFLDTQCPVDPHGVV
jgi:hypothetical protein